MQSGNHTKSYVLMEFDESKLKLIIKTLAGSKNVNKLIKNYDSYPSSHANSYIKLLGEHNETT